jgi:hypothetical protein
MKEPTFAKNELIDITSREVDSKIEVSENEGIVVSICDV